MHVACGTGVSLVRCTAETAAPLIQPIVRWPSEAAKRKVKVNTIDEFLAAVRADQWTALERLGKIIKAAAPKAEECIGYQLAAFRLKGRMLAAFGATAKHCAFCLMSGMTVAAHKDALKGYDTSKGTIRFQLDKPPAAALVRKLVKARIAENAGLRKGVSPRGPHSFPALNCTQFFKPR